MATTQLADVYHPLPFNAAADEAFTEVNAFIRSGVLVSMDELNNLASVGGKTGEMPFLKPLDTSAEPDYVSDDPASFSTPDKIGSDKQVYRLAKMHKSWSTMDFARELTLSAIDPLEGIGRMTGTWWAIQSQKRLVQSARGVMADNIANNGGDMVLDIYADVATPAATNIISAEAIQDAKQTSGDHQFVFTAIAMHSVTFNTLNKANLIDWIPKSRGEINFPTYLNLYVVVDDTMPVIAGTNSSAYLSILFAGASFGFGSGRLLTPSELERIPSAGDGGGQDIIHTRRSDIVHPAGYQFTSSSVAGESATLAELATEANWSRVMERKNVGMAFLYHNN